jgi:hypothetical protein
MSDDDDEMYQITKETGDGPESKKVFVQAPEKDEVEEMFENVWD